jgi:D-alanyl-D-alanine dipeptidase
VAGSRRVELFRLRFLIRVSILSLAAASAAAESARPPGFVDAAAVVPSLRVEMRYFGEHNFIGRRIDGYEGPVCLLTRQAAAALGNVQRDLAATGLGLKTFDCYRPVRAVAYFVRWGQNIADQQGKAEFYPDVEKRDLFREGYIASRSNHSRGSAVDLTLVRLADGVELDMGSPFDFFGSRSWASDRTISAEARANRGLLTSAMRRGGFRGYMREWWHFTLASEPFPDRYFDFPVK